MEGNAAPDRQKSMRVNKAVQEIVRDQLRWPADCAALIPGKAGSPSSYEAAASSTLRCYPAAAATMAWRPQLCVRVSYRQGIFACPGFSPTDLWHLAAGLSRRHTAFPGKIAVLCRLSGSGQGAFFALCAQNRGFSVNAFTSFEDAFDWLTADRSQPVDHSV
jgi:hypothetical protein